MAAVSTPHPAAAPSPPPEQRVLLSGITWDQYVALSDTIGDRAGLRLTYCEGELEIMSVSIGHESIKTMLARLVETYAVECGVDLNGYGNATFRNRATERGLEPDECYVLDTPLVEVPDLAIEVALTSGGIDRLEVYAGLVVPEVWIWGPEGLAVWRLAGGAGASARTYERHPRSVLLPALDLDLLTRFVAWPNQTAAVRAYREALARSPRRT